MFGETTLKGLIRKGFHEVPHMMIGSCVYVICVGVAVYGVHRHYKLERNNRMYKRRYTVVREEDFDPKKQVHPIDTKYPLFVW